MSYDIDVMGEEVLTKCQHCNRPSRERETLSSWNYTTNCAEMWRAAGLDLRELHGKKASECITPLENLVFELVTKADKYDAMNPPNKWGSRQSLVYALNELLDNFKENPEGTVEVSF